MLLSMLRKVQLELKILTAKYIYKMDVRRVEREIERDMGGEIKIDRKREIVKK